MTRLNSLLDWFLPPLCLGCSRTSPSGIDRFNLCPGCRQRLRPVEGARCPGCLAPLADPSALDGFPCAACRRHPPAFDRLFAGWLYDTPLREVVLGLKYAGLDYLAEALGRDLARRFEAVLADCSAVVPVPLHWTRVLRRGYNQAELIARELSDLEVRPLVRGLTRRSATRHQTGLGRRRRRSNLAHAFRWRGTRWRREQPHWLLVDDVLTTGATLDSAARALKRAGVGRVTALVVAITPRPEELRTRRDRRGTRIWPPWESGLERE
jgi:ComF family protein